jgi:two-component system sensor histidine kinase YesM
MSSALSRLLRFNLKESSHTITLKEELEVCKLYLQIQKYRYEDRLDFQLDISEWALEHHIPKFSLQPIIENCVNHGVDCSFAKTIICIRTYQETDQSYVIEIEDDGPGIEEGVLNLINHNLEYRDVTKGGSQIGIVNVHRRIEYLFGPGYGLRVASIPSVGTKISIRLPIENNASE